MLPRSHSGPVRVAMAVMLMVGTVVSIALPGATASAASNFQPLKSPARILDTRSTGSTADGRFTNLGDVGPNEVVRVRVTGRQGVPNDAVAAMLNVTAVDPAGPGFLTVFPCGANRPNASTVNYFGAPVANSSIATIGNKGSVCIYSSNRTHVLADISGFFPTGAYRALSEPKRMLDTRDGGRTIDGRREAIGRRKAGQTTPLQIGGRGGVGENAPAVALNVTAIDPNGAGFLSVFPCGSRQIDASNVNYQPGQTVPNLVVSKLNGKGRVCIYTKASAHIAVDVSGVLPTTSFRPLGKPQRLADTRTGGTTTDGRFAGGGAIQRKGTMQLKVNGRAKIPDNASAAILNITAVAPPAPGFLAVFPRGTVKPTVSNVNYGPGAVVANSAVARVGAKGQVCVFARTDAHVIVDVVGWLTGPAPPSTGMACPEAPQPPPATANPRDLVIRPDLHYALGHDRVAVLMCDHTDDDSTPTKYSASRVAKWANRAVAPWFAESSAGRFTVSFEPHPQGRIKVKSGNCLNAATSGTGAPFTNVMVVAPKDFGGGFGGPGGIFSNQDTNILAQPPSVSGRGFQVGGSAILVSDRTPVHELGHSLHWPHSFVANENAYDNPVDIMSGVPRPNSTDLDSRWFCEFPDGGYTQCNSQNTIAFNRMAAGWVDAHQVGWHAGGTAVFDLDRPHSDGTQLVVVADPNRPHRYLTVEARPRVGNDEALSKGGVALHIVGQSNDFEGISSNRFQRVALGKPDRYLHMLKVGESATAHGVTVKVRAITGEGYRVEISGTYTAPPASD